ncbi:MAG: FliM/FliN family flagellar motor switch protein [Pararhodobacter sp.]|nr:FliM/FliN family flagellar motor switch protein [Pararhodobacter sp.]
MHDPTTDAPKPNGAGLNLGAGAFTQVPIEIVISVGRARPTVRELLRLQRDSVLPLDRRIEDPVELFVGDRLIARGVLEELDGEQAGQMAVRLTDVADLSDGF